MHPEDTIAAASAHDPFSKIKVIQPTQSELVVPDPSLDNGFVVRSKKEYDELPYWSWWVGDLHTGRCGAPEVGQAAAACVRSVFL